MPHQGIETNPPEGRIAFQQIVSNPGILGGKPCIKGTRISVEFILELFASGASHREILTAYPHLTEEALEEALRYVAAYKAGRLQIRVRQLSE
jgi:uncharacterized protein (DUF433 family)